MIYSFLIAPFADFEFMRRALVGTFALSLGAAPIGVFLMLRRMSLIGDAMAHAILPGAAIGFMVAGLSLFAMAGGGLIAGLVVALGAGLIARSTQLKEDASLAAFFLISLALGVTIISVKGTNVDLLHFLFGSVLAVDDAALILVASITTVTLLTLALIYRPLVIELFDPGFLKAVGGRGSLHYTLFLVLIVLNLIAGFQALGTLMAVGLMILPAVAARFWTQSVWSLAFVAAGIALVAGYLGLLLSYYGSLPSGPSIVLVAGVAYLLSLLFGRRGSLRRRLMLSTHLEG